MTTRRIKYNTPQRGKQISFRPTITAQKLLEEIIQKRSENNGNTKQADILSHAIEELYQQEVAKNKEKKRILVYTQGKQ